MRFSSSMRILLTVIAFALLTLFANTGCGESACDSFLDKVCTNCESQLTDEWEAACACRNGGYVKAYGFHCKEPTTFDENSCRIGLDLWSSKSCGMLMRQSPLRYRIPED